MNSPIKLIYKYKNDNRKIQYQYYIFVGGLMSNEMLKIFKKIKDLNFFDTLISLNDKELNILNNFYGEFWYKFFFLTEHILSSIQNIIKSSQKRNDIIQKFSKEWFDTHFINLKFIVKSQYNYQAIFNRNANIKLKKNSIKDNEDDKDDEKNDYTTSNSMLIDSKLSRSYKLFRSSSLYNSLKRYNKDDDNDDDDDDDDNDNSENNILTENILNLNEEQEDEIIDIDNTYDIEELENMYKDDEVQIDQNPNKIKELIDLAIEKSDEDRDEKMEKMCIFPKDKNTLVYDNILKNVFIKNYVFNQYIFNNDTIKIIKQKICNSIQIDNKFNKDTPYIIPSRMYLWSEYEYNTIINGKNVNFKDKIMLGQKWITKNELLSIDIEPNEHLHIYEKLKGNLKLLKDNIKKYGSKIKRENDEYNVMNEYDGYYTNNEIFMIDIYNDIGSNYEVDIDELRNLYDVYIRIYYYEITQDEFKHIVDYVNSNKDLKRFEINKILSVFQNIQNDLLLEGEITRTIEQVKIEKLDYMSVLKSNFITQAVIHINLQYKTIYDKENISLYRIFDSFIVSEKYPFLQYQTHGNKLIIKFYKENQETDKQAVLAKWFENSPYGINFKIKINSKGGSVNKYIAVTLFETGRMEYKTQWKEEDQATITDIEATYLNIRELIEKINKENKKIQLIQPDDFHFKYAFINTIQHFELPKKCTINHNDLSEFARYFFPYISIVIDPRKRQSKNIEKNDKSKYGTYLRYKRISKYENEAKIENRIIHFLRNYEFIPNLLSIEISKQFNITEKNALEKIEDVVKKHPTLKKSRKILKKLDNISKFKPPGIGIDIQGKNKDNYKIKISGARSQEQLNQILELMAILLYLYVDTYFNKNPHRLKIKDKLKTLTNIAKRRNKVDEIINTDIEDNSNIKQITKLDKERIGFKPEKGQNQWTRSCQNSGDKNRRPILYTDKTIDEMTKTGYILNSKTGEYERKVVITEGKKKKEVIIKAIKMDNSLYYTCNPDINNEYMYVGFLQRSNNPNGLCMPCCFKKDPGISKNKAKKDYHLQCTGKLQNKNTTKNISGDKLYILQDSNKMLPGRFGYLSKYLDYFCNKLLNKTRVIKNNYLTSSETGYFMKFGSSNDEYPFLNAVASCLDMTLIEIKNKIINGIKNEQYFIFANSGDLKTQFNSVDNFLNTLNSNLELDHTLTDDLINIPGILIPEGINIYIIEKRVQETTLETDYILLCKNIENLIYYQDPIRKNIILLKEDNNYYPIVEVLKKSNEKNINIISIFNINKSDIISHLINYMNLSCKNISFTNIKIMNAKNIYYTLLSNNIICIKQIIDLRNKCKYLVSDTNFLIPTKPSGTLYEIPIITEFDKYVKPIDKTLTFLNNISKYINIKPYGFIYTDNKNNNYTIIAITIDSQISIPVEKITISKNELNKLLPNHILESRSLYDIIDLEIKKGSKNINIDDRIINIQKELYENEHYELFRFELANYLNLYDKIKNKIIKILSNIDEDSINEIKKILFKITSIEIYDIFNNNIIDRSKQSYYEYRNDNKIINSEETERTIDSIYEYDEDSDIIKLYNKLNNKNKLKGGENEIKLVNINNDKKINNYEIKNNRDLCINNKIKDECNINNHCDWVKNKCVFTLTNEKLIEYISRVSNELVNNELKSLEILSIDQYFISDIVNFNNYTYRDEQKIIKSNNLNVNKILSEIFGKSNIPIIGKRKIIKNSKTINDENFIFPIEKINNIFYQRIINNNIIFRSYANSFYWIINNLSDIQFRNLGYYSILQTDLANIFKSYIYDWIMNENNQDILYENFKDIIKIKKDKLIKDYRTKLFLQKEYFYLGIIDLFILNKYHKIPIVLFNQFDNVFFIIDDKIIYNNILDSDKQKSFDKKYLNKDIIKIKYLSNNISLNIIPNYLICIYDL